MRKNLHELPDLVRLAYEFGITLLSIQHLCHDFSESTLPVRYRPMREFVEAETLMNEDPLRVEQVFSEARAVAQALGISLRLPKTTSRPHDASVSGRSRCDWPWRGAYLAYTGEAMPCCMVATPDRINFGNMAREGVSSVWNNAAYETFREQLAAGPPPEVCRGCSVYTGTF
jgi:radical SAM protein with 4Fe4S-binding SPASM domain